MSPRRTAIKEQGLRTSAIVLIILTAVSIFMVAVIDSHRIVELMGRELWIPLLLTVSFAKVAAIGYWFMDLRSSAVWLRAVFAGWVSVFWLGTILVAAA